MSRLTVTAKTELKELITSQLEEMAEAINAAHEPDLKIIVGKAKKMAVESFGVSDLVEKGRQIVEQRAQLLEELHALQDAQDKVLNKPDEVNGYYNHRYNRYNDERATSQYLDSLMPAITEHHKASLLGETPFGQKLLNIKAKTQNVSKDILLATLPEQLTAVYLAFCEEFGLDG